MSAADAHLILDLPDAASAAQALAPDDDGFLDVTVEAGALHLRATSNSTMGLLRTLDDALACLRAIAD